ncbi:c-type cytochrome [Rhodanobacter sp. PCA2]|uniref:c-type cytochrome n=1 Tax=Rhodanobacter sp. PCA2 TaxID=2006117 RepID=UPI0015E6A689|nr:c-type cytochrome [Rhodanobacter sp. PCA2]MBA2076966.1 cytochrome c class I [Rhodanobacter sp. PCA2]
MKQVKKLNTPRSNLFAWFVVLAAVLAYGGHARAGTVTLCVDKSSAAAPMDTRLAQAVARHEGATLALHRFDGAGDGDDGLGAKDFHRLAAQCDLVLGFPVDAGAHGAPMPGLHATRAYGHTGFVLVTPRGKGWTSLASLPAGSRVAVTYQTTPNIYLADHPKLAADVQLDDAATLKALQSRKDVAAMLWRPTVVSQLGERGLEQHYDMHELDESHARFDLVALYDDAHAEAAKAFEQAVAAMAASGELAQTLAPYAQPGAALTAVAGAKSAERRVFGAARTRHAADRRCAANARAGKSRKPARVPTLYTQAQADIGKAKFLENCSRCHGRDLGGMAGPALKGANFASAASHFHVGDIFTIVSQNMPATQPGSLPKDDYVEIMAFLLQENGYPAGSTALTFDQAKQSKVDFIYRGQ